MTIQGTKEANPKQIRDIIAMQIGQPAQRTSASSTPMPHHQHQQNQQAPLVNGVHNAGGPVPPGHGHPHPHHPMPMAPPGGMPGPGVQQQRGSYPMPGGAMPSPPGQHFPMPGQLPPQMAPQPAIGGGVGPGGGPMPTAQNVYNKFLQVN